MEVVDRENLFSLGMAQPDRNRDHGVVVQGGEILALTTWREERKNLRSCDGIEPHYIAITSQAPSNNVTLFVYVYLLGAVRLLSEAPEFRLPSFIRQRPLYVGDSSS